MTVYNLEYRALDRIGRGTKYRHVGVYDSLESVSKAQQEILRKYSKDEPKEVQFNIYAIDNLFERVTQAA